MVYGHQYLIGESTQCLVSYTFVAATPRFELFILGFLAFMRYYIVCYNIKKSRKFWIISFLLILTPVVGLHLYLLAIFDANPTPSYLICSSFFKPKPGSFILSIIISFLIATPSWVSTYCYFVIGIKSYKKLRQMSIEASISNDSESETRLLKLKYSLIFQLSTVFIVFNIAYMPIFITIILRVIIGYRRPPFVDAVIIELYQTCRAVDPIITIIFQPELSYEFKLFLTKSKARFKSFITSLFR
ncbi:hypothetical protein CONCODRAFT_10589 [Conidiobolus coronatus NRRL 28638]|uniref:G-protein coupled receptors family 1 profile domain-containing protein n=1 Tax=Conidiobolus coronatus (strain ATCC 28846 / CBS 209.66 / NRRL 28638) TaxID=796925 RepID=A0A137NX61_CONC2|nr:hypothetical protein CONCODRAFT_10589 [Conidiobolus coronatus NRRL 28638]|eukprot:KXN67346.1 hypothetical protein CONCODRAFT_10589 [Conidiobolus coronatus NRRL 28638]